MKFCLSNNFALRVVFSIANVTGKDDVGGEGEDVSKANSFVSEASKLSAGARILRGPKGPEILVI